MNGARLSRLLARGFVGAITTVIVVVVALLTWPWAAAGPTADERRVADLQRLSHAIDAFRLRQHVLPASLARLPTDAVAPVHTHDPVSNRPYEYRPLGPLAYELCASFDAAGPGERRVFWWHDAGRHCFALEAREGPRPPRVEPPAPSTPQPGPDSAAPASEPARPADAEPAAPPVSDPVTPPEPAAAPPGAAASDSPAAQSQQAAVNHLEL